MSGKLRRIERIASQEMITDPVQIASLTKHFLGRSLQSLVPPSVKTRTHMTLLADDMAKGFGCTSEEIRKCSVGDVLMMISKEEENDFFAPPYENEYTFHTGVKVTAGHCIYLSGIFHNYKNSDIRLKALMAIELTAFIRYLKTALRAEYFQGNLPKQEFEDRFISLDRAQLRMMNFSRGRECTDKDFVTLGRVMEMSFNEAMRPWSCHLMELSTYRANVIKAYNMANVLFMECMASALVLTNKARYVKGIELSKGRLKLDEEAVEDPVEVADRSIKKGL